MSQAKSSNQRPNAKPLFALGKVFATCGALALLDETGTDGFVLMHRHQNGDWGCVPPEDAEANEDALRTECRILSSYLVGTDKLWIITEADRSSTTLLLPSEY